MHIGIKKEGFVMMADIIAHIEARLGYKIADVRISVKEMGDHDKGTFERKLEKINFTVTDKKA